MDIELLKDKINKKIGDSKYYYISNEIEHGLGLVGIVKNLILVCLNYTDTVDYLMDQGVEVFCLNKECPENICSPNIKSSAQLLEYLIDSKKYKFCEGDFFQTFKISPQLEEQVEVLHGNLMNTPAKLNNLFETKISQLGLLLEAGSSIPLSKKSVLGDIVFDQITGTFDIPFVIQFNRGHTGSGTHFINSESDFEKLQKKFPKREVRVSKFINGATFSANCCISNYKLFVGAIYKQITGVAGLTSNTGGTVGGSFLHGLEDDVLVKVLDELTKLETTMKSKGYRGLFGIDFIIDRNNDFYLIEINARQQMSVSFNSCLQRIKKQLPIMVLHIAEFLGVEVETDEICYNLESVKPQKAGQLYLRNVLEDDVVVRANIKTGYYKLDTKDSNGFQDSEFKKAYDLSEIDEGEFLLLTQKQGAIVQPGAEIARIQVLENLYDKDGEIKHEFIQILRSSDFEYGSLSK